MQKTQQKGFTLLEILLVIALIAILAGIVIVAINPSRQLANGRNAQRSSDVETILNAIYQYTIDNNGTLPANLASAASCATVCNTVAAARQVCLLTATGTCSGEDLTVLTTGGKYIVSMPVDPSNSSNANGTSYYACKDTTTSRVTVCAPLAENSATIVVTR